MGTENMQKRSEFKTNIVVSGFLLVIYFALNWTIL